MKLTLRKIFFMLYAGLIFPVLRIVFSLLARFDAKVALGLKMRQTLPSGRKPWLNWQAAQKPIWIHCASGEFEYAKPVITTLKMRFPDIRILVTYFSPSIAASAGKFAGVDFSCPVPWDRRSDLLEFITWHQPRLLLIARTDAWPELLRTASQAQLPSLLFSATITTESGRARGLGGLISRLTLENLSQIYCVSREDFEVFARLGLGGKTQIAGDTRYDQVQARLLKAPERSRELFADLFAGVAPENCFVAGSTWEEDETVLIQVARRFASDLGGKLRFVFVPHEPTADHLAKLEAQIAAAGLKCARMSTAKSWQAGEILLVDRVGALAELYSQAHFAFVGGSFRKSVHSVMEPLAAGCITFVGPFHSNNREALEFQKVQISASLHCVETARDADEFVQKLDEASKLKPSASEQIRQEITQRSGKSKQVVDWCAEHLPQQPR